MTWLNYHHLLYFWTVAREGSVTRACAKLHLAQPTISTQIHDLEKSLGVKLFEKQGRHLVMTEMGQVVYRYADEIFALGAELLEAVRGRPTGKPARFVVGAADSVPKLVVQRLLAPALTLAEPVHLVVHEGEPNDLLARLAVSELDLVLSDVPASPLVKIRAFNHLLGECGVAFFATKSIARTCKGEFPRSLDDAPFLMPSERSATRRALEQWFTAAGVRPRVHGEFDDSALLNVFGQQGVGVFAAPSAIATEVCRQFAVEKIGATDELRERFYAISVERKLRHPAVVAIIDVARRELFGS